MLFGAAVGVAAVLTLAYRMGWSCFVVQQNRQQLKRSKSVSSSSGALALDAPHKQPVLRRMRSSLSLASAEVAGFSADLAHEVTGEFMKLRQLGIKRRKRQPATASSPPSREATWDHVAEDASAAAAGDNGSQPETAELLEGAAGCGATGLSPGLPSPMPLGEGTAEGGGADVLARLDEGQRAQLQEVLRDPLLCHALDEVRLLRSRSYV